MSVYLDYAASTPLNENVKDWVIEHLDVFGNPSSPHQYGVECRNIIDTARENIADYMRCNTDEIFFTSGASQANTLALSFRCDNIFYTPIEHSSIIEGVNYLSTGSYHPVRTYPLKVNTDGTVDLNHLEYHLSYESNSNDNLVVIQWANNEIGTIQNISEIADLVHIYDGLLFVDATQVFPWLKAMDLVKVIDKIDMLSASAHKCGGMQGTGILYVKNDSSMFSPTLWMHPVVFGHQENGFIGGTENTLSIGAFGEAVKYLPSFAEMLTVLENRNFLFKEINRKISNVNLNGPNLDEFGVGDLKRLPNNLNIAINGVNNDVLMQLLDSMGIYCSGGSACNSHILEPSHVLMAIGLSKELANQSIRLTIDKYFDAGASIQLVNRMKPLIDMIRAK